MRYRVSGVWVSTRREGVIFIEAVAASWALEEALRRGLEAREVAAVGTPPPSDLAEPPETDPDGPPGCSSPPPPPP